MFRRVIIVVSAVPSYCQGGWWGDVRPGPRGDGGGAASAVRGRVRGLASRTGVHVRDRARLSALARGAERLAPRPVPGWALPGPIAWGGGAAAWRPVHGWAVPCPMAWRRHSLLTCARRGTPR